MVAALDSRHETARCAAGRCGLLLLLPAVESLLRQAGGAKALGLELLGLRLGALGVLGLQQQQRK